MLDFLVFCISERGVVLGGDLSIVHVNVRRARNGRDNERFIFSGQVGQEEIGLFID